MSQKHSSARLRLLLFTVILLIVSIMSLFMNYELTHDYTEEDINTETDEIEITQETIVETQITETVDVVEKETEITTSPNSILSNVSKDWDADDAYLLAKIAMAEAEGESTEGKALVICVVLNRVFTKGFPDTIKDVIFDHRTSKGKTVYQFSPLMPGGRWYKVEPNEDCYKAVEMVQMGWDKSNGTLYFTSEKEESTWHSRNLEFMFQYGGHKFYR